MLRSSPDGAIAWSAPREHTHIYQNALGLALACLAPILLWFVLVEPWPAEPANGFLPLLTAIVDLLPPIIAALIFVSGYQAALSPRKSAVVLLGVLFLGVGWFELLHAVPRGSTATTEQARALFALCADALAAIALLTYALSPTIPHMPPWRKRLGVGLMLSLALASTVLVQRWPPDLPSPAAAGWAIAALHLTTLTTLWRRRTDLRNECVMALFHATAMAMASTLLATIPATAGHAPPELLIDLYKSAAFLFLLHATFHEALRRPLELMALQHQRENLILDTAPDGVLWVNKRGRILTANPAMAALSGYPAEELVGQSIDIFIPAHLRGQHSAYMAGYFAAPHSRSMGRSNLKLARKDGQLLPVDISLVHWKEGDGDYVIAYVRDLREREKFEESLRYQATHDELTGLPNRWLFRLQLNQALANLKRSHRLGAVLLLDLDHFKGINDSFGHATGDELLALAAQRLRGSLREQDTLARLGGDEFGILLTDMESVDEGLNGARKILLALDAAHVLGNREVLVGGSIGLAFYPDDGENGEDLLRHADMAMYQAKQAGRGTYACYSAEMDRHAHDNMTLLVRLKEAIRHQRLRLFYQPQVDVESGQIVGAETLLRWTDDVLGEVSPARFIPVAEATGLILPLSKWVLETACEQAAAWSRAGMPLRIAVNFSAQQFRQPNLADTVRAVLTRTGLRPDRLEVEITESVAMSQPMQAREQLEALTGLGCSISLDDFGTGYSSLAYLKALPVSKLKIDRSFIKDIPHDPNDVKIARSIIALAHSLGLTVVAEGVETEEQLAFLRQHGCEAFQGWLFAKALDAAELTARLDSATV